MPTECQPFRAENRAGASRGLTPHVLWVFSAPAQRIRVGCGGPFTVSGDLQLSTICRVCHEAHFFPTADASTDASGKCRR